MALSTDREHWAKIEPILPTDWFSLNDLLALKVSKSSATRGLMYGRSNGFLEEETRSRLDKSKYRYRYSVYRRRSLPKTPSSTFSKSPVSEGKGGGEGGFGLTGGEKWGIVRLTGRKSETMTKLKKNAKRRVRLMTAQEREDECGIQAIKRASKKPAYSLRKFLN